MERRMRGNSHVRCEWGEKLEMTSKAYLSILNFLQETILQLVKSGGEADGNLFMVGDVKQSIYAFRLAEPQLFLDKYSRFLPEPDDTGRKIDLNQNFRSRSEVLDGTNYIFQQVMDENVGEIEYDERAALKYSHGYPDEPEPVELVILEGDKTTEDDDEEAIGQSQQEARYIIRRIQHMMDSGYQVYNAKTKEYRPLEYRDIVILMRSMRWSADLAEEFKAAGIPLYAESSKGYFDALEVMMIMNLLQVIDNPYQDIPLVAVLRAPFIGLTENELAEIRLAKHNVPFYEALKVYVNSDVPTGETALKLRNFMEQLASWRSAARRGSLADLIWSIYLETHYYEMVGAMVNGKQRQANLRALHDRALAYEKTSFRGLFRFLRFIDRMKSRGDDLGLAKSIGEADDVVRLVTIHSSKGLEFPVVFVAGLSGKFNLMDFNSPYLFDQKFGLAVKTVDPELRIMYTSLPFLALKEHKLTKLKAEEMRILYVAMTRAKEKLILVGSVKDWAKTKERWEKMQDLPADTVLPDYLRAAAMTYLDWIGPAVARHKDFLTLSVTDEEPEAEILTRGLWKVRVLANDAFRHVPEDEEAESLVAVVKEADAELVEVLTKRFTAVYPYAHATAKKSKTSVSEIKRFEVLSRAEEEEPTAIWQDKRVVEQKKRQVISKAIAKRPLFLQEKKMTSAEIGTVVHTVMQHMPQQGFRHLAEAEVYLADLVARELLRESEAEVINMADVLAFFTTPIGQRFKEASIALREVPFTFSRVDHEGDAQIVQGIIDCLFQDTEGRWVLLDYKTDTIRAPFNEEPALTEEMRNRYARQLELYTEAIEKIKGIRVSEHVLYLYDIGRAIEL